ncbi:hypothetical protein L3V83_08165 [Thiotrichales bacterium 19X7-9]|nr:hypothetical protein [Thiotrichales bacterium 19X7-9]
MSFSNTLEYANQLIFKDYIIQHTYSDIELDKIQNQLKRKEYGHPIYAGALIVLINSNNYQRIYWDQVLSSYCFAKHLYDHYYLKDKTILLKDINKIYLTFKSN